MQSPLLKKDMTILFQGDSITDCGRQGEPCGIGYGYVQLISAFLWSAFPELKLNIVNKGISGNRIGDLEQRWDKDCLEIKPDLLSILIGINDTWRRFDSNDPTSTEVFRQGYDRLLTRTRKTPGSTTLVLCEPFVLPYPQDRRAWREDLDPKIAVVRDMARQFNAVYVPFDGAFAAASMAAPCSYWAEDGVHPTLAGHGLMSRVWLRDVLDISIR